MNKQASLVGAVIAIGFAIQKQTAAGSPAHISGQETWKVRKSKGGYLVFAIEYIELAVVPVETEGYRVSPVGPVVIGANVKVILKYAGVRKIVGRANAQPFAIPNAGVGNRKSWE